MLIQYPHPQRNCLTVVGPDDLASLARGLFGPPFPVKVTWLPMLERSAVMDGLSVPSLIPVNVTVATIDEVAIGVESPSLTKLLGPFLSVYFFCIRQRTQITRLLSLNN